MLILKPVKGVWYIVSSGYPSGHWAAYSDEDVALEFMGWMFECRFDCDAILQRLHFGTLTRADRNTVKLINREARHKTRVVSKLEPVVNLIAKSRVTREKMG